MKENHHNTLHFTKLTGNALLNKMNAGRQIDSNSKESIVNFPPDLGYKVGENLYLHSPDVVFPLDLSKNFITLYTATVVAQYVCFFACLPFEDLSNRPSFCIVADFYMLGVVLLCLLILPQGIAIIPERSAFLSHLVASLLQFTCVVIQSVLVYCVACTKGPFQVIPHMSGVEHDHDQLMDVRTYIVVSTVVSLYISFVCFIVASVNCFIFGKGLDRLLNRVHRLKGVGKGYDDELFADRLLLPGERRLTNVYRSACNGNPYSPALRYPEDLIAASHREFMEKY